MSHPAHCEECEALIQKAENEIDFLRGHCVGAIKTHYFLMNKEYLAKEVVERFLIDCDKRYPRPKLSE